MTTTANAFQEQWLWQQINFKEQDIFIQWPWQEIYLMNNNRDSKYIQ